jgi:hypothetical protein
MLAPVLKSILLLQAGVVLALAADANNTTADAKSSAATSLAPGPKPPTQAARQGAQQQQQHQQQQPPPPPLGSQMNNGLEARMSDKNFIADILDRLHSLDADIGKLLFNASSMYAADDQSEMFRALQPKGGERFTEVLSDLDSLQDEVSRRVCVD